MNIFYFLLRAFIGNMKGRMWRFLDQGARGNFDKEEGSRHGDIPQKCWFQTLEHDD
jgi:hypothetical protein